MHQVTHKYLVLQAEAEQDEISEPPPNLAQILEENPITAGEAFPAFVVRVTNEHNQPQDGEVRLGRKLSRAL